jgi:hypothetical protein
MQRIETYSLHLRIIIITNTHKAMTIIEFVIDNTIEETQAIRAALCVPEVTPNEFLPKGLYPIGCGQYKGDGLFGEWTKDGQLENGCVYPIYHNEGQRFVIGKNGRGLKFNAQDWKEIVWF